MWTGKIEELKNCKELSKNVAEAMLKFIREKDMVNLPNGSYPIAEGVHVNVFDSETQESDGVFEAHKRYADVHYPIIGKETLLWANEYKEQTEEYHEEGDYSFGTVEKASAVYLDNQSLCYIAVGEPHKASVIFGECVKVKKAVFKILV